MADKQSLEFEGALDPASLASYLDAIAQGLRDGRLTASMGEQSLQCEVGESLEVELEIKADPAKRKYSLELDVSWRVEDPAKQAAGLAIGAPSSFEVSNESYSTGLILPHSAD
jgi:amphi-Trp domain-containing protein